MKTTRSAFLTRASLAVLLGSVAPVWQATAFAQTCSCPPAGAGITAGVVIRADEPPPSLPEYDQPPMPAPGHIWTPGYWAWNNYDYYWVPGTWIEPPRPGLLWTPGYWAYSDGLYGFHRGYWGEHVGFYGGVVYGFGYTGNGYEGGRWDNGHFFYNRVVNNFGNEHVTNVYEKNVVINNNQVNTRVSFSGGKGGIQARPTPAEEAAAREQHVPATPTQVDHARTASMNGALFQSNNHGTPAIAATARPAAFSGPGVVRAKESGSPMPAATPQAPNMPKPAAETRPNAGPEHSPAGTALQRPEVAPAHSSEMPVTRPGAGPAEHEHEHNAAPSLPQHNGPQGQHALEHNGPPIHNEPRQEPRSGVPAPAELRHGPVVEHSPAAPHAEPPHVEAPHMKKPEVARPAPAARPAPRPEPHAAARPPVPHPAVPHPAPPRPEEHQ